MSQYYDEKETRDPNQREASLMQALPATIESALRANGWKRRLGNINPKEIDNRSALSQLPVLRKSELPHLQAQNPPLAEFNPLALHEYRRIFMSPGPIFEPECAKFNDWRLARAFHALGVRRGDVIQNCFSYHFTPAAFMMEQAAREIGCAVIPAGTGQTELQVQAIHHLRPKVYAGTPSFLKLILEKAHEVKSRQACDLSSLTHALVSGEALPNGLRHSFHQMGLQCVLQVYATADIGNIAYESQLNDEVLPGLILEEELILEIVNPLTGVPLPDGEVGEVVITCLNPNYPLIRFATGDLSAVLPGISTCGRTNTRLLGWLGRADQSVKVRGMFIHPIHVQKIVQRHPELIAARILLEGKTGEDQMTLIAVHPDETAHTAAFAEKLIQTLREVTQLRGDVVFVNEVRWKDTGILIDDRREYN